VLLAVSVFVPSPPQLFGFVWKGQMRLLYPSTAAYATVMADVASFTGACTIGLMLVSKFFFQVCESVPNRGWSLCQPVCLCTCCSQVCVFWPKLSHVALHCVTP
jgi:ATP/ADP translocase